MRPLRSGGNIRSPARFTRRLPSWRRGPCLERSDACAGAAIPADRWAHLGGGGRSIHLLGAVGLVSRAAAVVRIDACGRLPGCLAFLPATRSHSLVSRCTEMAAVRRRLPTTRVVVSLPAVPQEPSDPPPRRGPGRTRHRYRVVLRAPGGLAADGVDSTRPAVVQPDTVGTADPGTAAAAADPRDPGDTARGPGRPQSLAALGRARGRGWPVVLVHFGRLRIHMVALRPAGRLPGYEPRPSARLLRASGGA